MPKKSRYRGLQKGNVVNGPKHCFNLTASIFTIFIDHLEGQWDGKSHSLWHAKSGDYLVTHWLLMTSILFLIEAFYYNVFRYNYLKNKKILWIILSIFQIYIKFWTFSKKLTLIAYVFAKLRTPKKVVRKMPKKSRFRGTPERQRVKRSKTLIQS